MLPNPKTSDVDLFNGQISRLQECCEVDVLKKWIADWKVEHYPKKNYSVYFCPTNSGLKVELDNAAWVCRLNGVLHREDGPAVIHNGYMAWYRHGKLHRYNGPAIISTLGLQGWYIHGKKHRVDGPAAIFVDGTREWWNKGKFIKSVKPSWNLSNY